MDNYYNVKGFGYGHAIFVNQEVDRILGKLERYQRMRNERLLQTFNLIPHEMEADYMKIKFDRYESGKTNPNAAGKIYNVYRVFGTALSGKLAGQEWSTQIFANQKEMAAQIKALNKGDIVNVTMKNNGKFWNPTSFEKDSSGVSSETVPSHSDKGSQTPNVSSAVASSLKLKNLEIAVRILGAKPPKKNAADYMMDAASIADMVQDYVDGSGAFQFDNNTDADIPEVDEESDE